VLGAAGTISLPKGSAGFDKQAGLLQEEGVPVIGGRVRMREWQWQPDLAGTISLPKGSAGFDRQAGLLQEEGVPVIGGRVRMREWQWQPDLAELLFLVPF